MTWPSIGILCEPRVRARSVIAAAATLVLVFAASSLLLFHARTEQPSAETLPVLSDVGGDFELTGAGGARVRLQDYRGQVVLLFFGYTYCPDVCPTSLYTLRLAADALGGAADRVQVMMVTVDPARDSPDHVGQYMRHFHSRFIGLSGTSDEIERVARLYRVFYRNGPAQPHGYSVSHSAHVYLLDPRGRTRALFGAAAKPADVADGVRQLLQEH